MFSRFHWGGATFWKFKGNSVLIQEGLIDAPCYKRMYHSARLANSRLTPLFEGSKLGSFKSRLPRRTLWAFLQCRIIHMPNDLRAVKVGVPWGPRGFPSPVWFLSPVLLFAKFWYDLHLSWLEWSFPAVGYFALLSEVKLEIGFETNFL